MRYIASAVFAALALSSAVRAEGAVQVLDCTQTTRCDPAGVCLPDTAAISFTLTPVDVGRHGEGTYTIAYNGASFEMTNIGMTGPYVWAEGVNDLQTLMPSGPHSLLWVRQDIGEAIASTTFFLTCEDPA